MAPRWFWADDSPSGSHQDVWVPYSPGTILELEKALAKKKSQVAVDENHYVKLHWQDGKDMYQARNDNKHARRKVKREDQGERDRGFRGLT